MAANTPLPLARIVNASVGLMGVQVVWGLQNVTTSRVFQAFGARVADLPILWIAAPVTGLLVQPVIGWLGDRTRTRFGQRRPYLAVGTLLTVVAMIAMAEARNLAAAVAALWLLTASVNMAMQPLRAMLADIVPAGRRATGYAVQVVFIGTGAVGASCLPWLLARIGGSTDAANGLPTSVRAAFVLGAAALLVTIGWTLWRTPESSSPPSSIAAENRRGRVGGGFAGLVWLTVGAALALTAFTAGLRREVNLLALIAATYGGLRLVVAHRRRHGRPVTGPLEIVDDIAAMPPALRHLAVTQFFTWFGLFALWIYAVPAVAARYFGATDPQGPAYNAAADWVGVLFAVHDGVATVVALLLPRLFGSIGLGRSHAVCLTLGAVGLAGFVAMPGPGWLWLPSLGIGCAWASILSTPYAIVAEAAPRNRLGVYLGIHNIFLVLPQLVAASVLGVIVDRVLGGRAIAILPFAALAFAAAAVSALRLCSGLKPTDVQHSSSMQEVA